MTQTYQRCVILCHMPHRTLVEFFHSHTHQTFKAKQVITDANTEPLGGYFIESGVVKMSGISPQGKTFTHTLLGLGSVFPLIWIITKTPNRYAFETLTPASIYRADPDQLHQLFHDHVDVLHQVLTRYLKAQNEYYHHTEIIAEGTAQEKLQKTLDRLNRSFGPDFQAHLHLTHQELANLSGLSRETVSRLITHPIS